MSMRDIDYQDTASTVAQFILTPDVPLSQRKYFEKYYLIFSKIMALGNIDRRDILPILWAFDEICLYMEMGMYDDARQLMAREITKMQASRSVGGFQTIWSSGSYSKTESIAKALDMNQERSTKGGMLRRLTGKKRD